MARLRIPNGLGYGADVPLVNIAQFGDHPFPAAVGFPWVIDTLFVDHLALTPKHHEANCGLRNARIFWGAGFDRGRAEQALSSGFPGPGAGPLVIDKEARGKVKSLGLLQFEAS